MNNQYYVEADIYGDESMVLVPWIIGDSIEENSDFVPIGGSLEYWVEIRGAIYPEGNNLVSGDGVQVSVGHWYQIGLGLWRYQCTIETLPDLPPGVTSTTINFDSSQIRSYYNDSLKCQGGRQWQREILLGELALVAVEEPAAPAKTRLEQNSPNPFNPVTSIGFTMAHAGQVKLQVYDLNGRLVQTLVNENRTPGQYSVSWNGTDNAGQQVSSGVYFYKLQTPEVSELRKMTLVK